MRKAGLLFGVFFLASSAAAQSPAGISASAAERQFNFNGSARLIMSRDSMTDRQICYAETQNFEGAWIMATGEDAALVSTMDNIYVDYTRPALLRIGEGAPFPLSRSQRPHAIGVPPGRAKELVRALYSQKRVRVRIVEWPDGAIFNGEIKAGDFAAAYDRGVELCGWPRLGVTAVHPAVVSSPPAPEESEASAAFALEAKDAEAARFRAFTSSVEHELRQNWVDLIFPAWSRAPGVAAHCVVTFSISEQGIVKDVHLSSGSGDPSVDDFAQRAVLALGSSRVQFPSGHASPIAFRAIFDWASSSVKIAQ